MTMELTNIGQEDLTEAAMASLDEHFAGNGHQPESAGYWLGKTGDGTEFFFATNTAGPVWSFSEALADEELNAAVTAAYGDGL